MGCVYVARQPHAREVRGICARVVRDSGGLKCINVMYLGAYVRFMFPGAVSLVSGICVMLFA